VSRQQPGDVPFQEKIHNIRCFLDGRLSGGGRLDVAEHPEAGLPVRIGFCDEDFPRAGSRLAGDLDEIGWYAYALGPAEVERAFRAARPKDRDEATARDATIISRR
jgi:hypothetical protein